MVIPVPASNLTSDRKKAAEFSRGISSNVIYSAIERVFQDRDLTGHILDYGAGTGSLARRLVALNRFETVSAADIMPDPGDMGPIKWIEQDLNEPIQGYDGAFDVVVAAEVIEHLENPRFTMREIFKLLRPGGTAIVTTPNNESWRSLVSLPIRGHFAGFGDLSYPAHITALLRKDFTRIFQETALSTPTFHFTDHGGIPGRPHIPWQRVSFGMLRGLRYSDNIIAVAQKRPS